MRKLKRGDMIYDDTFVYYLQLKLSKCLSVEEIKHTWI